MGVNRRFIVSDNDTGMIGITVSPAPVLPSVLLRSPATETSPEASAGEAARTPRSGPVSPHQGKGIQISSDNLVQAQAEVKPAKPGDLTEAEEKLVKELKQRDKEVRRHEEAHARAGAPYTSAPSYQFQRGPDGGQYAIGGKVSIDVSPVAGDPEATLRKMEVVKRAASAPSDPSGADRAVASQANATAQAARAELAKERQEEQQAMHEEPEGDIGEPFEPEAFVKSVQAYQAVSVQPVQKGMAVSLQS